MTPEILKTITRYQMAGTAVASLVTLLAWPAGAAGVFAGGLVMTANFWFMRTMMGKALSGGVSGAKILYGMMVAIKFVAVLALVSLLVVGFKLDPLALAIGLATLFVGITGGLLHHRSAISQAT